jgi:hypothetical protein
MQTAALLQKPMHLGEWFDYDYYFDEMDNPSSDIVSVDDIFIPGSDVDYDFPMDYGADIQPAFIDSSGDASTVSGQPLITANALSLIATANPGREAVAVAQSLKVTNPDWTKQFKDYDSLVRAAAGLFTTVKAVLTGQPIPRSPTNPYVYGPGQTPAYRPSTGLTTTHMLLIGGAALAAILLLRRK